MVRAREGEKERVGEEEEKERDEELSRGREEGGRGGWLARSGGWEIDRRRLLEDGSALHSDTQRPHCTLGSVLMI